MSAEAGVKEACWDLRLPPDPSLDTCGLLKLITAVLKNCTEHGVNEGKEGVYCLSGDVLRAITCV